MQEQGPKKRKPASTRTQHRLIITMPEFVDQGTGHLDSIPARLHTLYCTLAALEILPNRLLQAIIAFRPQRVTAQCPHEMSILPMSAFPEREPRRLESGERPHGLGPLMVRNHWPGLFFRCRATQLDTIMGLRRPIQPRLAHTIKLLAPLSLDP